jgi:hypothetical protein
MIESVDLDSTLLFAVLCGLSDQFEESDDTVDPLFEIIFHFLMSKTSGICEFILAADTFLDNRARALDLVRSLLGHPTQPSLWR